MQAHDRDSDPEKSWPSIIMLFRRHTFWSAEELSSLADAAWGRNEAQGRVSPKIVESNDNCTVLQLAPTIYVNIIQADRPYSCAAATENGPSTDKMWDEHIGWSAVDIPNRYDLPAKERRECYKLLLHFINKVWSADVYGLYLPAEEKHSQPVMPSQIPNVGDLITSIKRSGAIQPSRIVKQ
jgi:hypothetical protein